MPKKETASSPETPKKETPGSLEMTEDIIRYRAYQLFEQRGCEPGHDLEDWLQAEAEVMGKKIVASDDQGEKLFEVAAA